MTDFLWLGDKNDRSSSADKGDQGNSENLDEKSKNRALKNIFKRDHNYLVKAEECTKLGPQVITLEYPT